MEREDWNRRWLDRDLHCRDDPTGLLVAELGSLPPGRALDLGCGGGRNAVWLAERGWQVTGVDFSEVALELARRTGANVEWVHADLRDYEPQPESFELVLVLYLHVQPAERRQLLARAAAALAPGGTLLLVGHDLANLGTGAPGPTRPEVLYTAEGIARELPGLAIEKAERVTRPETGAVDTLVVARKERGPRRPGPSKTSQRRDQARGAVPSPRATSA